jgi:hypothetical protein
MRRPRSCTEVGPGDWVKLTNGNWERILTNSAFRADPLPREWQITTFSGVYGMWDIAVYAVDGDPKEDL